MILKNVIARRSCTVFSVALASVVHAAASGTNNERLQRSFPEQPPVDSRIIEMMKTNAFGSIEARISFVEKWEITGVQKAQVLLSMLSIAEEDDQRKLAHAAVTHVATTNFALVRSQLLNPKLPRVVLSVFMTDTLKRDFRIKLPLILSLAQSESHPMQAEAQQLLRGYLGGNHGTNWMKWEESMDDWLKNHRPFN